MGPLCQVFIPWLINLEKKVFTVLQIGHLAFHEDQTGKLKLYILLKLEAKRQTTNLSRFGVIFRTILTFQRVTRGKITNENIKGEQKVER